VARCRSCNAEIRWARTAAKKRPIPLDLQPSPEGNVHLVGATAYMLNTEDAEQARRHHVELFVSHFATCPHATTHRKTRT
jgi:hypothetical protein